MISLKSKMKYLSMITLSSNNMKIKNIPHSKNITQIPSCLSISKSNFFGDKPDNLSILHFLGFLDHQTTSNVLLLRASFLAPNNSEANQIS